MKRLLQKRNNKGFSLAELMIAVAIIIILAGVSFVGVTNYTRSMELLEMDGLAREIYFAAQNHIVMAEGQNYPGVTYYGSQIGESKNNIYHYTVNAKDITRTTFDKSSMLGLMLPFGSVDETIRVGGNYIIRYQIKPARVIDVFYSEGSGRYSHVFNESELNTSLPPCRGAEGKGSRKNYDNGKSIIGWYGDNEMESLEPQKLNENISIVLENGDVLKTKVTIDYSSNSSVRLIIEGLTSGAAVYKDLSFPDVEGGKKSESIILDDITTRDRHFSQIKTFAGFQTDEANTVDFIPGEDIRVYATVQNNGGPYMITKSAVETTNSLFGGVIEVDETGTVYAEISVGSLRHLANLYENNSGMFYIEGAFDQKAVIKKATKTVAVQTDDLDWDTFLTNVKSLNNDSGETVYINTGASSGGSFNASGFGEATAGEKCWLPISPSSYSLEYDGGCNSIQGIKVDYSGASGLFGTAKNARIENLELINFDIKSSTGSAGSLAGVAESVFVQNVIANNSVDYDAIEKDNIKSTKGSAGGLIGSVNGGTLKGCAATLIVNSDEGDAGGLIGTIIDDSGVIINGCYSGGHTVDGNYYTETGDELYNIKGKNNVGGLIGSSDSAIISHSYSTCSVSGGVAGGFIGTGSGNLTNCYSTGLVKGTEAKEGAFAGSYNTGIASGCYYFEIINEREIKENNVVKGYGCLGAVGGTGESGSAGGKEYAGIIAFDGPDEVASKSATQNYNDFLSKDSNNVSRDWSLAVPYDPKLSEYYNNKYNLRTVAQLGADVAVGSYVLTHYGDWPAPEIFVINTAS